MKIGERLKDIMNSKHLAYCKVASTIGLSKSGFCDMLKGRRLIRIEHILPICKALNITPDDLFLNVNDGSGPEAFASSKVPESLETLRNCQRAELDAAISYAKNLLAASETYNLDEKKDAVRTAYEVLGQLRFFDDIH